AGGLSRRAQAMGSGGDCGQRAQRTESWDMSPVARFTAVARRHAILTLLAGCGALGKIGAGSHNPPATLFTVSARVTAVIINGGSGSIDVTGSSRSTVAVSQQVTYSGKPPTVAHALRGTTLTLSYSCPGELLCGISYAVFCLESSAV